MYTVRRLLALTVAAVLTVSGVSAASVKHHSNAHSAVHSTSGYTPAALADQITSLPGLAVQPTFNQFSGYLVVDEASQRSIHYWYVESQNAPATDPLIWWSNGGPGCSGLLGLLTEHGPFRLNASNGGETIEPYQYSWNTVANVLYVEAPAGVGFSFSNNPNDYNTNDTQTAADNLVAIQQFFIRFPHLTSNSFFLSAESYGGHYVPQLAALIVAQNSFSNFHGFLLGNPLTDGVENAVYGQCATLCGHSLASKPTCDAFRAGCITNGQGSNCNALMQAVIQEAGNLDAYGLDYPVCNQSQEQKRLLAHIYSKKMHSRGFSPVFKSQLEGIMHPINPKKMKKHGARDNDFDNDGSYDPCGMSEEAVYLNRADVRTALHISPKAFTWAGCSTNVNYDQTEWTNPQESYYTQIIAANPNLRLVVYSGDDDSVCGTLGTQYWMYNLFGNQTAQAWTQWMYNSVQYGQQIGGSIVQFTGISFVTVHSAGHMVPQYQPERGLQLLTQFLAGAFTSTPGMKHNQHHKAIPTPVAAKKVHHNKRHH